MSYMQSIWPRKNPNRRNRKRKQSLHEKVGWIKVMWGFRVSADESIFLIDFLNNLFALMLNVYRKPHKHNFLTFHIIYFNNFISVQLFCWREKRVRQDEEESRLKFKRVQHDSLETFKKWFRFLIWGSCKLNKDFLKFSA